MSRESDDTLLTVPEGYKPLELGDKDRVTEFLRQDPPATSELTFTNLFMWRHYYRPVWRESQGCLLVILHPLEEAPFGLPPVGLGDRAGALETIMNTLAAIDAEPRVSRAGRSFVEQFVDDSRYSAILTPDQSDYVYLCENLINLSGRKLHQKKNHLNQFLKTYSFEAQEMGPEQVESVLEMQEAWCSLRNCLENPSLQHEDLAVYEALTHFKDLDYRGLAIVMDGQVEAFTIGEPLNPDTVVVHVEKANPEIRGLSAAINQRSCEICWPEYRYINREQDLGVEGLRQAKRSYQPDHLVDKFDLYPTRGPDRL